MKAVWLSALSVPEQEVRLLMQKMQTYGLSCSGHQWKDDLQNMAWMGPMDELCDPQTAIWAIMGTTEAFQHPETRYGLSLLAICVQARKGAGFPIVILQSGGDPIPAAELPSPLQRAIVLPAADAGTPAKLVAKAHAKVPELQSAYHINMVGNPQFGQWFEVRPTSDVWQGIIFGVDEAEIKFQAVGPGGELPKTSTLHYPMQGLQIDFKEKQYAAWAVRNEINMVESYFVKIEGAPGALLFGAFSEESEAEMYHIQLK